MNHFLRRNALLVLALIATLATSAQEFAYSDSPNPPGLHLKNSDNQSLSLTFSIDRFKLEEIDIKGQPMKNIVLSGAFVPADEGMPNLPSISRYIAIPNGATPVVKVTAGAVEHILDVDVAPAPRLPLDNDPSPLFYEKNQAAYSKNVYLPEGNLVTSQVTTIRGVQMIQIAVMPFRYNAVARRLEVMRDLTIDITFKGGNGQYGDNRLRSRWWDPIINDMVINPEVLPQVDYNAQLQQNLANPTEEQGAEYLIIRANSATYAPWADSIKNWRVRQGITTMIKTVDEVGGNTVTAIENYLNNAYNTWTTPPAACLLIGDYGTDGTVNIMSPIYNNYCVSDNILGDVNNDQLPDIVMARITANNATQLATMVSKGLNYERNPPTSAYFYGHPITALGWQTERWFQICSEAVGGYFANVQSKTPVRINEIYSGTPGTVWSTATNTSTVVDYFGPNGLGYIPATPSTLGGWSGGNATMINNAINAGAFILQHRDHGMETGWGEPSYTNTNINGLTNTDLTFIFSINCLTGKYNWSNECFTEKFHRYTYNNANSGALGLIGASEVSYSFVNDTYVWGMFDNMWPDFMPAYGTTPASRGVLPAFGSAAGKYFLQQSSWPYNTSNKEVTYHLFHMHGDAFMQLFSEVPQNLTVAHAPVLYAGVTTFQVTAPAGSFICLTVNNQIIGTGNGTGSPVNITIPAQVPPSQMIVTVTKQNYRRYTGYVSVVPAAGPYIVYDSHSISDPTGNNNGQMDFGEVNGLNVGLKNVGVENALAVNATLSSSDAYVSITDNTQSYGTINAGATVMQNNAFSVTVANNIPDQHVVNFAMATTSGT
ncbi:MAG: C25 family cysteine peptidase, partial [Bacteroidales bacterium]|nr:C25 family cysteine peptidase [Bacteroidales bacterium]